MLLHDQRTQTEIMTDLQQKLKERDSRLQQRLGSSSLSKVQPDFVLGEGLTVAFDSKEPYNGRGSLKGVGNIICYPILPSITAKENLDIYLGLQEGAYVQRFYGTLKADERYYAVMEDFEGEITLNQACREHLLPASLLERADLAADLAKSVAWFHRADVVLKSISDRTVMLKKMPSGKIYPFLTNLENLRTVSLILLNLEIISKLKR
jgi:hypothetical protein